MRLPVLMYHAVHEDRSVLSISPDNFARQMAWLDENGFQVVPLRDLASHVRNGKALPPRAVSITFDDGFECLYRHAFPILAHHGFHATIFLVAGYIGRMNDWSGQPPNMPRFSLLTWQQIREMDRSGITFGSHTRSHPRLDSLSPGRLQEEICDSKALIEDGLGHAIEDFAYPYGRYNQTIKALVGEAYQSACSTELGMVRPGSDPLEIERVDVYYLQAFRLFQGLASPFLPLYLEQRKRIRRAASIILRRTW